MCSSDLDVLVIGEVSLDGIHDGADAAEQRIGMPVQAVARSRRAWLDATESFLREVRSRPLVPVLIDEAQPDLVADLDRLTRREPTT